MPPSTTEISSMAAKPKMIRREIVQEFIQFVVLRIRCWGRNKRQQAFLEEDLVEVQQRLDAAVDGGHAEDVVRVRRTAKIRGGFQFRLAQLDHLLDGVHDGPHQHDGGGRGANLDDDNAGAFAVALARELELGPEVENRNDFAPEIDDALDVLRHPGDRRDGTQADDLADAEDRQPVGLPAQLEGQVAPRFRGDGWRGEESGVIGSWTCVLFGKRHMAG